MNIFGGGYYISSKSTILAIRALCVQCALRRRLNLLMFECCEGRSKCFERAANAPHPLIVIAHVVVRE